jgi:glycosyltransferase involved in cell wall biosynthesis
MTFRVSIIIPCYNQRAYLGEAIESACRQSCPATEVVVVNDGSNDGIEEVVGQWPGVVHLRQPNRGVASARNLGASRSCGDYLLFLDADDRLLPNAVNVGLVALQCAPDAIFAAGLCRVIGKDGSPQPFQQQPEIARDRYLEMLRGNFIWMPAQVLYRRGPFMASGGFDSSVNACADYDLYLRLTRGNAVACHRDVVAEYRSHGGNMSGNGALMLASALSVLDRQWPHVRFSWRHRQAYYHGRRFWQDFYGDHVVEEIRANLRTPGRPMQALRGALFLLRHHPVGVLRQLKRKLRVEAQRRWAAPESRT